jgi:hypothetical protein
MRSMTPVYARLYVVRKITNSWQVNDFHRTEGSHSLPANNETMSLFLFVMSDGNAKLSSIIERLQFSTYKTKCSDMAHSLIQR